MPRTKGKVKCYVITANGSDYTYGAFPYSKDGLKIAKIHLAELSKKTKDKYRIREV